MTVIMPDSDVIGCGKSETISPALIAIPFEVDLESLEGMLVSIEHARVTSTANLWREGEIVVSDAIKRQPSDVAAPFTPSYLRAEEHAKENLLVVEDNSDEQNPALLSFYPAYSYNQSIRIGDTVSATGPLLHKDGTFRLNPVTPVSIVTTRSVAPSVTEGNLSIATFNVLNYFNGMKTNSGSTTFDYKANRGAKDKRAFLLQQERIVSAILAIDADVVGLMEIENDGFSHDSAIAALSSAINASLSTDRQYQFIETTDGKGIGTDAITVGLLYRGNVVEPVNQPLIIPMPEQKMKNGKLARMRPSLVQVFNHKVSNKEFAVAVNHFKSKGSKCAEDIAEQVSKQDVVQGSCNALRVSAAVTLGNALKDSALPARKVILGDFNAYSAEDPLAVLTHFDEVKRGYTIMTAKNTEHDKGQPVPVKAAFGYHNLAEAFDPNGFSYWYYGSQMVGSLDHVLASSVMLQEAVDGAHWNINSVEAYQLQYNQALRYFNDEKGYKFTGVGPYRSSDHDPFIATFNL